jgi:hypothetical protein
METRTRSHGCGFPRVRVRVALENPRVARGITYISLTYKVPFSTNFAAT